MKSSKEETTKDLTMKALKIFVLASLLISVQFCLAQNQVKEESADTLKELPSSKIQPIYVIKVDGKTLDIGRGLFGKIKLDDIETEWISSVQVIKDEMAIEKFGIRGQYGVVVIQFKDFNLLSKELQQMFNEVSKD